jgi:hydrogenase maturation protease
MLLGRPAGESGRAGGLAPVRVIGIGRPERGDDAVGRLVARRLAADPPEGVCIMDCSGEFAALLDLWEGAEAVVIVDALQSGDSPGTIVRLDARLEQLPTPPSSSTHGFGLAEAVEIAKAFDRLPPVVLVYGVEGLRFDLGADLSAPVAAAVEAVTAAVRREAVALAARISPITG